MIIEPNWDVFKVNAGGNPQGFFEWFCYLLFCKEYGRPKGITRYKNQAGIETDLIQIGEDFIGWQAKFYDSKLSAHKVDIERTITKSKEKYPSITQLDFYSNSEWGQGRDGGKSDTQEKVEKLASSLGIRLVWKTASYFESPFVVENNKASQYFFSKRKIINFQELKKRLSHQQSDTEIALKYIHDVHHISYAQKKVNAYLGGRPLFETIQYDFEDENIFEYYKKYIETSKEIVNGNKLDEYQEIRDWLREILSKHGDRVTYIYEFTNRLYSLLESDEIFSIKDERVQNFIQLNNEIKHIESSVKEVFESELYKTLSVPDESFDSEKPTPEQQKVLDCQSLVSNLYYSLGSKICRYVDHLSFCLESLERPLIYVRGAAGKGKTHLAFNLALSHIEKGKPAVFFKGKRFGTNEPLAIQACKALELPSDWEFSDYLNALNILGECHGCRVPLIIDSIHEARHWNQIWQRDIGTLEAQIANEYPNILLVLTYRTGYEEELFQSWVSSFEVGDFLGVDHEVIHKYFSFYKIRITSSTYAFRALYNPLYLRIFCETKNAERKRYVSCSILQEDIFDVFDQYISTRNTSICKALDKKLMLNMSHPEFW